MPDLIILTGPSGVGKSTLLAEVLPMFPQIGFSVSWTTRDARPGEVEGRDYHFVGQEEFAAGVAEGQFLEHATVYGRSYGTRADVVAARKARGMSTLLDIDPQGCRNVHEAMPRFGFSARWVAILPPSATVLERRLRGRGTESEEVIRRRLDFYPEYLRVIADLSTRVDFHLIVNDDLDHAAGLLLQTLSLVGTP